jgi:hypothetical protein
MYLRGSFVLAASLDSGVWQGTCRLGVAVELTVIPERETCGSTAHRCFGLEDMRNERVLRSGGTPAICVFSA